MTRSYKRKTNRGSTPRSIYVKAMELVKAGGRSVRSVASELEINRMTLKRYIQKVEKVGTNDAKVGYYGNRQVFNELQETTLERYLLNASNIYFGLTPYEARKLAFECAEAFSITMPKAWMCNKLAGRDWYFGFMKRHPSLSVRTPEPTSLSRATSFNKTNVEEFFSKLKDVTERYKFNASDVWNVDETGITTVQKPRTIVAGKGVKQIGAMTSAERGSLVTVCGAINATGNSVPPMFIFPRKHYKDHFIRDGPPGCIGVANPSGWMTEETFLEFLKHFVRNVKPTTDKPVLLLLDNHYSHLDLQILLYAKANGIVLLSFPPHCSHKLQPLDRTVYGPLKRYVSTAQDSWIRTHPGVPMTIYDIPGILKVAWPLAVSQKNAIRGFEVAGIWPLNENIFLDIDFAPSFVTDRPEPKQDNDNNKNENDNDRDTKCNDDKSQTKEESGGLYAKYPMPLIESHLDDKGLNVIKVNGDGHCLLHAIEKCLIAEGLADVNKDDICKKLENEVRENIAFYQAFETNASDLMINIEKYIVEKQYNTDTGDLVLAALCNAFEVSAKVFKVVNGTILEIEQHPRVETNLKGTVLLTLEGNNAGSHYNAVVKRLHDTPTYNNMPGETPVNKHHHQSESVGFSPEEIRPFPKAGERKKARKCNVRKRKSAILTDTPERKKIEDEFKRKQSKTVRTKPATPPWQH